MCEAEYSSSAIDEARKNSSTTKAIKQMLQPIGVETSAEPETKGFWSWRTTSNLTVSQCLKYFTRDEVINDQYLCRNCQKPDNDEVTMTSATKRTLISSPPAVLVLRLKRFEQKSTGFGKRDEMIAYDELLDLGPFCSSSALRIDPDEENVWYSLYAVVIHRGSSLSRGRYVSYVKQRDSSAQLEDTLREKYLQENFGDREKCPNDDDLAALEKRHAIKKRETAKRPIPIPGPEQDVWAPPFGRRRLGAAVWAPPFGRTAVWAPDVWAPALMREEIRFMDTIIISSIPFKLSDENDACFTAIDAGWTDINVDTYSSMKITRVSLQSKLNELMSLSTRILRLK